MVLSIRALPLLFLAAYAASGQSYTIQKFAGTGIYGFSGDGGPAVNAQLHGAYAVVADAVGNVFIADYMSHRVRRVSVTGVITTVAGNGLQAPVWDGGSWTATAVALPYPLGLALDTAGNLYISSDRRIRKVTPAGVITTVAGGGGENGDNIQATRANLGGPLGLAFDGADNLYFADSNRVRRVSPSGVITTVAGTGVQGFSGDGGPATSASLWWPLSVAVDSAGNLYISEGGNERVRKVSPSGVITTMAGTGVVGFGGDGGPATNAQLSSPTSVAVDAAGNLFVSDRLNYRIRRVSPAGVISTIAGSGARGTAGENVLATGAQLLNVTGVAVGPNGSLYIADVDAHRVRVLVPAPPDICQPSVNPSTMTLASAVGNGSVSVTRDAGCGDWMAASDQPWLVVTSGSPSTGDGTVQVSFTANPTGLPRTATLTIAGQAIPVTQGAAACAATFASASVSLGAAAVSGNVAFTLPSGCTNTPTSSAAWLTPTLQGAGTLAYAATGNTTTAARTATITFAGAVFTVTQLVLRHAC